MPTLDLSSLDVPEVVRAKLVELSASTDFDKQGLKGANGYLFFGTNLVHQQKVAVKFYYWAGDHAYHAEPRRLAELDSPNVTRILDAAFVDSDWAYFITPYFELGDLDDEIRLGSCDTVRAINVTRDLLNGLSHLHSERLLHRDLKPQNVFVADDGSAIIGDFGSVKFIPDGHSEVPGSGHSLLYRPPESVSTDSYAKTGDLYQVGLVLYQLLGGRLPYDETAWLRPREMTRYLGLDSHADRSIYATQVLKLRIEKGQVVDLSSLPPWICIELKRLIAKACHVRPGCRFQSCAEFLGKIGQIHPRIGRWAIEAGNATRRDRVSYRILDTDGSLLRVQKRRTGAWRNDNTMAASDMEAIVAEIESRCR